MKILNMLWISVTSTPLLSGKEIYYSLPQQQQLNVESRLREEILELAVAAAGEAPCSSRATRAVMSSFSVDIGVLEVCELREIELFEGERAPEGRNCGLIGTGGARFLPLPSTLPPPKLLLAAMLPTPPWRSTFRALDSR